MADALAKGVYRHKDGGLYRVVGTALESTNGRPRLPVVIYVSLDKGEANVRDLAEFTEAVAWPDGVTRPRFEPEPEPGPVAALTATPVKAP